MMNKEEYKRALEHLVECKQRKLCDKCNFKFRCTMTNDKLVIENLIEQHFQLIDDVKKLIDSCGELLRLNMMSNNDDFIDTKKRKD